MLFPFSLAAVIFCFFAGTAVAGLLYFVYSAAFKKKISASKISLFIISLAFLTGVITCYFVFFIERKIPLNFLKANDLIYLCCMFGLGVLFFIFTKICLLGILPVYLIFSFVAYFSLSAVYPRRDFFEYKSSSQSDNKVIVVCQEISPYILLPMPRVWYKLETAESVQINPIYSFMKKALLTKEKKIALKLPAVEYYPAVYKVNVKTTSTNLFLKAEPLM